MPGRIREETRELREASREFSHRHCLLSMAARTALVAMVATRQSTDEDVKVHNVQKGSPGLSHAPALDLTTPRNVSNADKSRQAGAWRHSTNDEFGCLLHTGTFALAPA